MYNLYLFFLPNFPKTKGPYIIPNIIYPYIIFYAFAQVKQIRRAREKQYSGLESKQLVGLTL